MCVRVTWLTSVFVACIIGTSLADCPLPPHPAHGRHQAHGSECGGADRPPACDGAPGTPAPEDWLLVVNCDPGYQHPDPAAADVPSVCSNGVWSIPTLHSCTLPDLLANDREQCSVPDPPPHSQYRPLAEECGGDKLSPGSVVPRDCILFIVCAPGYGRRVGSGDMLIHCSNNTWNPTISQDLCSRVISTVSTTVDSQTPNPKPPEIPSVSTSPVSSTGCVLPSATNTSKFCPLSAGCEKECDFYNSRCHLPSGSRADRVKVVCAPGHRVQTNDIAVCVTSGWYPSFPKCLKLCRPLVSDELLLKCRLGTDIVDCSELALPGTTVSFQCLPSFSEYSDLSRQGIYRKIITCKNSGEWSGYLPPCKPGCGVSKDIERFTSTIVDGAEANVGLFPWHAGLYYRVENEGEILWDQKCGGSLITDRVVLTAAHCVKAVTDKRNLRVALGKYYRSWNVNEPNEQKRNVTDFQYPNQYNPSIYGFDIALILLSKKIKFGEYIMPVCRDYNEATIEFQNLKLYVVGWGKINAVGGPSSENLLYNTVTPMSEDECRKALPVYYSSYEKFCGYKNNSESITQKGDSGGGLTAVYRDGLHYIVGIVSSKYVRVSMFTNIKWKLHSDWIDDQIRKFENMYTS